MSLIDCSRHSVQRWSNKPESLARSTACTVLTLSSGTYIGDNSRGALAAFRHTIYMQTQRTAAIQALPIRSVKKVLKKLQLLH